MNAREIVTGRIVEQARRFPDWLNLPLETTGLDARDAALAAAIDHAVMRRWLTLTAVIESRLSRPWAEVEFRMQAALLVGAAQLLLLDRLPDHAVINEAVEWAKQHVRPKAAGMVNAVLRKVAGLRKEIIAKPRAAAEPPQAANFERDELPLHDGRVWKLNEPVFAEQAIPRLAQQTSHAESLLSHWRTGFGEEKAALLALHSLVQAPIILHGVERNGASSGSEGSAGGENAPARALTPHEESGFSVFTGNRDELGRFMQSHPGAIVQDPTAAAVANATADLEPSPRIIIDACAGMGTKTRQLARLHPGARIIAADIAEKRTDVLRREFGGHPQVTVIDHHQLHEHAGAADLLVLDVPCSNTGVLARRVEAKYRFSRETQEKLANLQRQIIADCLFLLAASGRLIYSTCSVESTENQQQAQWLCKWHPFRVAHERLTLPVAIPGDPPSTYRDGGYYAVLERTGKNSSGD